MPSTKLPKKPDQNPSLKTGRKPKWENPKAEKLNNQETSQDATIPTVTTVGQSKGTPGAICLVSEKGPLWAVQWTPENQALGVKEEVQGTGYAYIKAITGGHRIALRGDYLIYNDKGVVNIVDEKHLNQNYHIKYEQDK